MVTTPTAQEATQNATVVSMVLTNLRDGDEVYIAAATDKDASKFLQIDPQFRLGTRNFQILSQFQFNPADSAYHIQANGDGSYTVSVSVDLNQATSNQFYLQAVIVKPSGSWAFSALEQVTLNRSTRRQVRGECRDSYGTPPVANFTFSPTTIDISQPVQLDATQSTDSNGSIVEYAWLANGQELYGITSVASFSTPGKHPVKLTVIDDEGCTDTIEQAVTVLPPPPCFNNNGACIEYVGERTKSWGDPLDMRYHFQGFDPATHYDVYIAFSLPSGEFLFLQPQSQGEWFTPSISFVLYEGQAIPYLSDTLIPDQEGTILGIDAIPNDLPEGTYIFYVAAVLPNRDPFDFAEHILLSQTEISLSK
ncbi:hypothetical protein BGP_2663 [Beggiatoa sp. PS]|nr:hypothetical protein BGP_2663 [Beggiatoa sp. PS]